MTKFLVGSGCCPLKTREANQPANAAKITSFAYGAYSRFRPNSLRVRRRRVFREAKPRLMSRPRLKESNIPIFISVKQAPLNDAADRHCCYRVQARAAPRS